METDTAKLSTVELIIEVIKYKCDKNQSSITCALLKKNEFINELHLLYKNHERKRSKK